MASLYFHIPFCRSRCPYCDFYSQVADEAQLAGYVELLLLHLQLLRRDYPHAAPLETIFFGGGTPSLLSVAQLERLLRQSEQLFGYAAGCEISLEGNPGTLDLAKLQGYRRAGVNRLSLGVQSLNDERLRQLGRRHDAAQARMAIGWARQAGFDNLSVDLIFALPGLTPAALGEELATLLELQPEHLSLYGLTVEPETEFAVRVRQGELVVCGDEEYAAQYSLLSRLLTAADYEHYEISNFARPGYRCRHNQVYWRRQDCLALGCGGHAFVDVAWGERRHIPADLAAYRADLVRGVRPDRLLETFDREGAMAETAYLALRTCDGLSRTRFRQRFGVFPEEAFPAAFRRHADRLILQGDCWRFDLQGWLLYDHLISDFL